MKQRVISTKTKQIISQSTLHAVLAVTLILTLLPLGLTLINSMKSLRDYQFNMWLPSLPLRFFNYGEAWSRLSPYFWNTMIVSVLGVGGMLLISSLASYAIGKIRFPGSNICLWIVLSLMMLPGVMTLVPSVMVYRSLHLNDTIWALIFPIWTNGCLMSTFLLTTFFRSLPLEIFEAAEIDGAGELRQYASIALPLSLPMVGTCTIIQIVSIWNDYLWPMTIQSDESLYTLPAGILFNYQNYENVPEMYASYVIAALPLLFIFIFLNKYYVKGLLDSAIKM
ncbi:MAG: carbohydrate ABC transporter permease [Bacilli bacterium]|nr:carbohydrate ABC transporter permease [Bacilli bacterium]